MIVIEANEIPNSVFQWYALKTTGPISQAINENRIADTLLDDVEEEYLYPSQAWASISTGVAANIHNIRWYNDATPEHEFYWRVASKSKKSVALMNVLHTGSISDEEVKNYSFVFPDFFSIYPIVNKKIYRNFQKFNHYMSISSGRKTSKKDIFFNAFKDFFKYPFPSAWGLSIKDFSKWVSLLINANKDSEVLRNAQFLLQARIFINEIKNENVGQDLSVFFTNHVASCLHRNFHDLFSNNNNDKQKKIKIFLSMKILDNFILDCKNLYPNRQILILSAMGQKLNKKVDNKYKDNNKTDYKITDLKKFLSFFINDVNKVRVLNEMIPQYTFKFLSKVQMKNFIDKINIIGSDPEAMRYGYYVPKGKATQSTKGFFCHIDVKRDMITCTTSVRPQKDGFVYLNGKRVHFENLGFSALKVHDYHHGEHSKHGCLISINSQIKEKNIHFTEIKDLILSKI